MDKLTTDDLVVEEIWRLPASCGTNMPWLSRNAHVRNHYQLIHRLCSLWPDENFFDAGCGIGASSVAALLGMRDGTGHVYSCDVQAHAFAKAGWQVQRYVENHEQRWHINLGERGDMNEKSRIADALQCKVILLDGPHTGKVEECFIKQIVYREWKGVMIIDDTLNRGLHRTVEMVKDAARKSWDLTTHCHHSGTLLADFGQNIEFVEKGK